jgi:hypothetical protein
MRACPAAPAPASAGRAPRASGGGTDPARRYAGGFATRGQPASAGPAVDGHPAGPAVDTHPGGFAVDHPRPDGPAVDPRPAGDPVCYSARISGSTLVGDARLG